MESKIPFTVIGGYLGAGKTTLLNHILKHNQGQRFAMLINDFGSINIDADLIESQDDRMIKLSNGCICCSLGAELAMGINAILEQDPLPDRVIVEASGVSDPAKIALHGQTGRFSLDGVIVVVDAETVRARASDKYVGRTVLRQFKSADLIIVNKTDLVTPRQIQEVVKWLDQTSPSSRIIEAQYGSVPLEFLFGGEMHQGSTNAEGSDEAIHHHDLEFETWNYSSDVPLSREALEAQIARLPETVVRAKGFVYLEEEPDYRMTFQLVGKRWHLTRGRAWGDQIPGTILSIIALSKKESSVR